MKAKDLMDAVGGIDDELITAAEEYKKTKKIIMVLQWIISPVIAIVYSSFCAFYSQTRLMIGRYMEKFDVTKKSVKK